MEADSSGAGWRENVEPFIPMSRKAFRCAEPLCQLR